jgi:hypothetical protein
MSALNDIWGNQMNPGDRVIWLCSPTRSFLSGWRPKEVRGVVVRDCRHRLRIRIELGGREKVVTVDPENVIREEQICHWAYRTNRFSLWHGDATLWKFLPCEIMSTSSA